jgi:CRISPR-associated protein Csx10
MKHFFPYRLTLRAPTLLTGLDGDPDSAFTLDHVPGSVIRGAVASGIDPAREDTFRALVLEGGVRYLHAWPVRGDLRAVRLPVSLRRTKHGEPPGPGERITYHDVASYEGVAGDDHVVDGVWPEDSLAGPETVCANLSASDPGLVAARRSSRVHQQRDPVRGRAWTDRTRPEERAVGTIFNYEYLDAGQTFEGLVLVEGATQEAVQERFDEVRASLRGALLLGRSRRAGYGGEAALDWKLPRAREIEGAGVLHGPVRAGTQFRALLTSPCIARSELSGQVDPAALPAQLEARLGKRARVTRRRWDFALVGGFNRHWGLELPQALAVSAGSVLVLEATEDIPHEALLVAEREGVGERRVEGFGRVCFLDAPTEAPTLRNHDDDAKPVAAPQGPAPALVSWIEQRLLAQRLDLRIADAAREIAGDAEDLPTNSLLGRLRVPLRGDPAQALQTLRAWLGDSADALKRPARAKLDRCRIKLSQKRLALSDWMIAVVDRDAWVSALCVEATVQQRRVVSEGSARRWIESKRDVWRVRLLDATFAAMAVRAARERSR